MTDRDDRHPGRHAARIAQSFVSLADTLVDDFDVVELLDRLVTYCVDLLEVSAAGILLINRDGTLEVVASSDEASRLMEVFQLQSQTGPCIEAIRTGEAVSFTDLAALRTRWPAFAAAIEEAGFDSVHALPLRLRDNKLGALNMFGARQHELSEFDARLGQAMADVATIAILQQRSLSKASLLAEQLQHALDTRIRVEQAKGVIAEYGGVDMSAAFEAIRSHARRQRQKLSGIAASLVSRELDPGQVIDPRSDR